jgi:hypothetical protein
MNAVRDLLDPTPDGSVTPIYKAPKRSTPTKKNTLAVAVDPFDIGDGATAIDTLGHQGSPGDPDSLREEDKKINAAIADAKFRVIEAGEFLTGESTEPEWQIEEFVPKTGIGLTYGPSKSFKSFGIIPKAYAIHTGNQWHDRTTRKGRAVIIVCEGVQGYRNRLLAYAKQHGIDKADMPAVILVAPNLFKSRDDLEALIRSLSKKGATYVAIDTQNHVMVGGDESSTKDMNIVYGAFAEIARRVGCFIEIISHTGHGDQSHARGSSVQRPAVDVEIYHERIESEMTCRAIVRKLKDGDDNEVSFTYTLEFVPLGTYAKSGKPFGSLAIQTIEDSKPRPVVVKAGKHDAIVLETFDLFKTRQVDCRHLYTAIAKKLPPTAAQRDRRDKTAAAAVKVLVDRGVFELVADGNAVQRRVTEATPENDPFPETPAAAPGADSITNLGAAAASLANKRKLDK